MDDVLLNQLEKLKQYEDFYSEELLLLKNPCILAGFRTLFDVNRTKLAVYQLITGLPLKTKLNDVFMYFGKVIDFSKLNESVFAGKAILFLTKERLLIEIDPVSLNLNRPIHEPINESSIQTPLDSFVEDLSINIGLIRKRTKSRELKHESFNMGESKDKKVALLYYENKADNHFVKQVTKHLETNSSERISNLQELSQVLGFNKGLIFPMMYQTELSFQAIDYLEKGRLLVFIDGQPAAYVIPVYFWDTILAASDKSYPFVLGVIIRAVRVIGILLTLILPALYVALVAVNPEVLRIELALSVAQSREGVPYPAFVEMIIMSILIELILEASVRLPKSIGPAITMVGGIILSTAIVEAKLVSNLLIIIIAATTISNSAILGFQNMLSIRVFKYILIILAGIFGVFGIMTGLVFTFAYLAGLQTYGVSYLDVSSKKAR
ncbi:spore germination protein [Fictibacillus nanhaiensis]|uniref:Spore germination protein n=1 Tax=Fictibacillus nanhaiensis TaxID=742169 RepID=A0ABS2ZTS6_9BACL|nr:spore germination protein [Fictibacillus nanhaiensis]